MMASMICVVMVVKMIINEMMVMSLLLPSGDLGFRYPLVDVLSLFPAIFRCSQDTPRCSETFHKHFQMFSDALRCSQRFSADILRMFLGNSQDVLRMFLGCSHNILRII